MKDKYAIGFKRGIVITDSEFNALKTIKFKYDLNTFLKFGDGLLIVGLDNFMLVVDLNKLEVLARYDADG